MKILVTGAAGFIGMHVSKALLERGDEVVGIDNLNDYYEVQLKYDRLKLIDGYDHFTFIKMDMANRESVKALFEEKKLRSCVQFRGSGRSALLTTEPSRIRR